MKRVVILAAFAACGLLVGCTANGVEFNGVKQVEQFPVRKLPIVHYNLPSEVTNNSTGDRYIDPNSFLAPITLTRATFQELPTPGNDLWAMDLGNECTDNPNCPLDTDWHYAHDVYNLGSSASNWPGGPNGIVNTSVTAANEYIAAWVLSLMNQWFLRDIDGAALLPAVAGNAPVQYDGVLFKSMPISICDIGNATASYFSPLLAYQPPVVAQQETTTSATPGLGANGVVRIQVPASNVIQWQYADGGAPAGMLGDSWREPPAVNRSIETTAGTLNGVEAPPYFSHGGTISTKGGVYLRPYADAWNGTTSGPNSTIKPGDGPTYSYYMSVVGCHLIGYGLGLLDSAFALPGVTNGQEDIMNINTVMDMTGFIAAGKEFQFVTEDLLRMQDTVNGDWMNPGPKSTLPGSDR